MSIIGTMLTQPFDGGIATSALPHAPTVEEPDRPPRMALQAVIAGGLRRLAAGSGRLAERVEPRGSRVLHA